MGFLKKLFGSAEEDFVNLVRAHENGEEWATEKINQMWQQNDSTLLPRIYRAYVTIYADSAAQGNREAILKYARGLEWSGRENEALNWYMKLINNGDTDAMLELALDYSELGGMGENASEKMKWIRKAAEMGNPKAQGKLALEYSTANDMVNADIWAQRAAEGGIAEGKFRYAEILKNENMELVSYTKGQSLFGEAFQAHLIKKYNITSADDAMKIREELYSKAEELYIDYLNEGDDDDMFSDTLRHLAFLYLFPWSNSLTASPYMAAYYFYRDYYFFENDSSFAQVKKIVSENHLEVTNETLREWQNQSVFDWAEAHGIALF